jgi:hypothetical protein
MKVAMKYFGINPMGTAKKALTPLPTLPILFFAH